MCNVVAKKEACLRKWLKFTILFSVHYLFPNGGSICKMKSGKNTFFCSLGRAHASNLNSLPHTTPTRPVAAAGISNTHILRDPLLLSIRLSTKVRIKMIMFIHSAAPCETALSYSWTQRQRINEGVLRLYIAVVRTYTSWHQLEPKRLGRETRSCTAEDVKVHLYSFHIILSWCHVRLSCDI